FADEDRYPRSGARGIQVAASNENALAAAPLLGRDRELDLLAADARVALRSGDGGLATVVGPTGIGKSALARAVAARAAVEVGDARMVCVTSGARTLDALLARCFGLERPADVGDVPGAICESLEISGHEWAPVALALGWIDVSHPALRATRAAPGA